MFTPPPSPLPLPAPAEESSSPPSLTLTKPEQESEFPFPRVTPPKSSCIAEASPPQLPVDVKKRSGKRMLLFVTLLPAALIISASLRHFMRIQGPVVLDEPIPVVLDELSPIHNVKREPQQLLSTSGLPSLSYSASFVLSSSDSPSSTPLSSSPAPTTTTIVPTVPVSPTLPTPFPQPFDASLSDNFTTTGCQAFFANFTQDESFRQCRSFAFLLNSSAAFLQAQRNLTLMNNIIWGTCNTAPTAQTCDAIMSNYLSQLNSICQKDITAENPDVMQAQISFESYTAMRIAACLPDASTNAFCYIEAAAAFPANDIYFYALPLGTPVPNTTKPSCSPCVKSVLAVYAQYVNSSSGTGAVVVGTESGNSTASTVQPTFLSTLSKTYPSAARIAVNQCGGTYASVGVARSSGAEQNLISWAAVTLSVVVAGWPF